MCHLTQLSVTRMHMFTSLIAASVLANGSADINDLFHSNDLLTFIPVTKPTWILVSRFHGVHTLGT